MTKYEPERKTSPIPSPKNNYKLSQLAISLAFKGYFLLPLRKRKDRLLLFITFAAFSKPTAREENAAAVA